MVERLDIESAPDLLAYLRQEGRIAQGEVVGIDVLRGGVSNRTVRVERANGEAWVLKQALAKLRVKEDWFADQERVLREATGIHWLSRLAPPNTIMPLVFVDKERFIIAMKAAPEPHVNWKVHLMAGRLNDAHVAAFGNLLGAIHTASTSELDAIQKELGDRKFFESLRLEPYYAFSGKQCPSAAAFLDALIKDTRQQVLSIVHGDYSPKNILIASDQLILLDHEVIHVGDPAFDVGFALTHLLSKAHALPAMRMPYIQAARTFLQAYQGSTPAPMYASIEERIGRHLLACMLARVVGRSPLEYLDEEARDRQKGIVLALLPKSDVGVHHLINQIGAALLTASY